MIRTYPYPWNSPITMHEIELVAVTHWLGDEVFKIRHRNFEPPIVSDDNRGYWLFANEQMVKTALLEMLAPGSEIYLVRMVENMSTLHDKCAKCHRSPDGDVVDSILYYECGHAFCEPCERSLKAKHPETNWPEKVWCSVCDKFVRSNYAPSLR